MNKNRFEAFTDAVIAIILTILVLDIKLPEHHHSIMALLEIKSQFFAYAITFINIAAMWINHSFLFSKVKKINNSIIWINMLLLFFNSLYPAATSWLGSDIYSKDAAFLYSIIVLLSNLTYAWLRYDVLKVNQLPSIKTTLQKEKLSLVINLTTLGIVSIYPPLLFIGLGFNLIIWVIPEHIHINH